MVLSLRLGKLASARRRQMIVLRCKGGLGNQLFQYAAGRALAERHGVPLRIDDCWYREHAGHLDTPRTFDLKYFRAAPHIASNADLAVFGLGWKSKLGRGLGKLQRGLGGREHWVFHGMGFDPHFLTLGPESAIEGYFQHPSYFASIQDQLRHEFQLCDPLPPEIL